MVALIRHGVPAPGGVWADLGAGTGNFTFALADLLGPEGTIYAVDRDAKALAALQRRLEHTPPGATLHTQQADVTRPLHLPPLDGILMANLLHFVARQTEFLAALRETLVSGGRLLVVEYEQPTPLPWAPYPVPLVRLAELTAAAGFTPAVQVAIRRSASSGRAMFAAVANRAAPSRPT